MMFTVVKNIFSLLRGLNLISRIRPWSERFSIMKVMILYESGTWRISQEIITCVTVQKNAHRNQFFRVTSCSCSVLYERHQTKLLSCMGKVTFSSTKVEHSRAPEEQSSSSVLTSSVRISSILSVHPWVRGHICVHSASWGPEVQIWQEKTVYRCPKNYPIKREFGTWFHADHLLLKSCSNTVKSLAIIEQIFLNLLSSHGLSKCCGETCGDGKSTGGEALKHMAHVLHLMVPEHSFEGYDLDCNLDNWPRWDCQSCLKSYHL